MGPAAPGRLNGRLTCILMSSILAAIAQSCHVMTPTPKDLERITALTLAHYNQHAARAITT